MKKSTTKRALFLSFASMFLCFAMLLGTTYAWFTDSVNSGVNTIVAGNLDVGLEYASFKDDGKLEKVNLIRTNKDIGCLLEMFHGSMYYYSFNTTFS